MILYTKMSNGSAATSVLERLACILQRLEEEQDIAVWPPKCVPGNFALWAWRGARQVRLHQEIDATVQETARMRAEKGRTERELHGSSAKVVVPDRRPMSSGNWIVFGF